VDKRTASPRTAPPTSPPPTSEAAAGGAPAEGGSTTTSPRRPTPDDVALLSFAQSFELTSRDLYQAALDAGVADSDLAGVFTTLRDNHDEYANRLSAILGVDAPRQRDNELYDELVGGFEDGDPAAVAPAGVELEATAVATHADLIGRLAGTEGAAALASFLVVEARHGTVLADIAGGGDDFDALLAADAEPLQPPSTEPAGWKGG
jgi:ferritin-like protein